MKIIGIVAEYNPFHNGHKYQIDKIKEKYKDSIIIVCMSSSFTQRGEISILNKWDKTKIAIENGVDLVIELPYLFTVQGSDIFAKNSIALLNHMHIDTLCFGSETEDINKIINSANIQINNRNFDNKVKEYLDLGVNYPTALNNALIDLGGYEIKDANDLLALSYIKEIIKNKYNIEIFNIKRTNSYHDIESNDNIVSSSNIRYKISQNSDISNQVPQNVLEILNNKKIDSKYFEYLKYKIISEQELNKFLDVDEGLSTRIKNAIYKSNNLEELIQNIKTKRYTYNKISRMLNHILCSIYKSDINNDLEYIRILGFNNKGKTYLNSIKSNISLPILNKYDTKKYEVLNIEKRVSDIYSLIYEDISKKEIENIPIKKD